MERRYIPITTALRQARENNPFLKLTDGICACYEVSNMGFCKDGKTRWYHFYDVNGTPAYTIKR